MNTIQYSCITIVVFDRAVTKELSLLPCNTTAASGKVHRDAAQGIVQPVRELIEQRDDSVQVRLVVGAAHEIHVNDERCDSVWIASSYFHI